MVLYMRVRLFCGFLVIFVWPLNYVNMLLIQNPDSQVVLVVNLLANTGDKRNTGLISGSSAFSKSSLNIWKFTVHVLLKPDLENFEHYFASVRDEGHCVVLWAFFGIAFLWDWTSLVAQTVKRLSTVQETWVQTLGWEDPLEKEMAIHSSTIAWKIPWTEEPGGLQSTGLQRVGHDWASSRHLKILWHCPSLGLEWKLNFPSPLATAEFSKFAGILSAAL